MKRKSQTAFGAINIYDSTSWIYGWTLRGFAHDVRSEVADAYKDDESDTQGWAKARKAGMRAVKVELRITKH